MNDLETDLELPVVRAEARDLDWILKLQYLCYQVEAQRYDVWGLDALTQTSAGLATDLQAGPLLVVRLPGGEVIGSVRGRPDGETLQVGRLVVHPRFQRRGLSGRLLAELEARAGDAVRLAAYTGADSQEFLAAYRRAGFAECGREVISPRLTLVHLDKSLPRGSGEELR